MQLVDTAGQIFAAIQLVEHELLLFCAFWILLGAVDDFIIDLAWIWLRLTGKAVDRTISEAQIAAPLRQKPAIFIAAWQEEQVIADTVRHALLSWAGQDFVIYVGCYRNDTRTIAAAMSAAGADRRLRVIVHQADGPTTKADCLNRLYFALCEDERRRGASFGSIVLHDSEDMVHRAELAAYDLALRDCAFVQIPVRPEPQAASQWVAGHYTDEFSEAHAKELVVRDALGVAMPAAGVGCAFSRDIVSRIAWRRTRAGGCGPFAADSLTEDYELGLSVSREGGRSRFLRLRDPDGELVATRAYFPASLDASVRQKARWIHGIALQGWERLGWDPSGVQWWMALRDRRGPLTAIVLSCCYLLLVIEVLVELALLAGIATPLAISPSLRGMTGACIATLVWRCLNRVYFTAREYGLVEGLSAIARIPVANVITIIAGRRAMAGYVASLQGKRPAWDKTVHSHHPTASFALSKGRS